MHPSSSMNTSTISSWTQISDGYFCGISECRTCDPFKRDTPPGTCKTVQCDSCGKIFTFKDKPTEICSECVKKDKVKSILKDIEIINDKLKGELTERQRYDWQVLLDLRISKLKYLT